jgi:phosphoglycolate phosphatase
MISRIQFFASRAAGFDIICMSYGYNHGNDIRDAKPDLVIDSMAELKHYL